MSEIGELLGVKPDAPCGEFGTWMESIVEGATKTDGTVSRFDGADAERGTLLQRWWE